VITKTTGALVVCEERKKKKEKKREKRRKNLCGLAKITRFVYK
jgi:hypothetical protein